MKKSLLPALMLRQPDPHNLEFPFSTLDGTITPNERFYVRNHFPAPSVNSSTWRLRVQGAVARPLSLSLKDLKGMTQTSHTAVLECAGNSRAFLSPKVDGVQWELGAVGCARWTGVRLAIVLEHAGLRKDAVDIVLEGADSGTAEKSSRPDGPIHFARSIPVARGQRPEILLAYEMNGQPLPLEHGAPLRAVVPGWYAMASVKWLTRVLILQRPFQGYFQTVDYAHWLASDAANRERVPLSEMCVKSQIARPAPGERIKPGQIYRVHGAAWSSAAIVKVEVSADGGRKWTEARLLDKPREHSWRLWEYRWKVPAKPGPRTLMARATDAHGRVQPNRHDKNHENYVVHHTLPLAVEVR